MANYAVQMVLTAVDRATAPVKRVQKVLKDLRGRAAVTARALGLPKVTDALRRVRSSLAPIAGAARDALGPLMALGVGGAAAGLWGIANSASAAGDDLAKMGERTGLAVEAIQELEFAASRSGTTADEFRQGMRDLTKNIGEAVNGTGEAKDIFKALGVELRDAQGRVRSADAVFMDIADSMAKVDDPAQRSAAAMKLMGETGGKMANMLAMGSGEIQKLRDEKRQLGVITTEQANASAAYVDQVTNMEQSISDLKNQIGIGLFPVLGPIIDRIKEFTIAHKPQIVAAVSAAVASLAQALEDVDWNAVIDSLQSFGENVAWVWDLIGGLEGAMVVIGSVMMAGPLSSIITVTRAVWGLGAALMGTPVGWVIAAVAAIAVAVYLIYTHWDSITAWFWGKIDSIRAAFSDGFVNGIWALVKEFNPFTLLWDTWDGLLDALFGVDLKGWMLDQIQGVTDNLPDWLKDTLGLGPIEDETVARAREKAEEAADDVEGPGWFASDEEQAAYEAKKKAAYEEAFARAMEESGASQPADDQAEADEADKAPFKAPEPAPRPTAPDPPSLGPSPRPAPTPPPAPRQMAPPPMASVQAHAARMMPAQPAPEGELRVVFENTPPGTRVEGQSSGLRIGTDVNYGRSLQGA